MSRPRPPADAGSSSTSTTGAEQYAEHLSAAQVQAMLASGDALPLLPEHSPVPVRIAGRWWLVPAAALDGHTPSVYRPAEPDVAAMLDRLEGRLAAVPGPAPP